MGGANGAQVDLDWWVGWGWVLGLGRWCGVGVGFWGRGVWDMGAGWHWCLGWWGLVGGWVTQGPGGL